MPEHTALAILSLVCSLSALYRLVYGKILMVCTHHLHPLSLLMVKADEVAYDVNQSLCGEYALKESVIVSSCC